MDARGHRKHTVGQMICTAVARQPGADPARSPHVVCSPDLPTMDAAAGNNGTDNNGHSASELQTLLRGRPPSTSSRRWPPRTGTGPANSSRRAPELVAVAPVPNTPSRFDVLLRTGRMAVTGIRSPPFSWSRQWSQHAAGVRQKVRHETSAAVSQCVVRSKGVKQCRRRCHAIDNYPICLLVWFGITIPDGCSFPRVGLTTSQRKMRAVVGLGVPGVRSRLKCGCGPSTPRHEHPDAAAGCVARRFVSAPTSK